MFGHGQKPWTQTGRAIATVCLVALVVACASTGGDRKTDLSFGMADLTGAKRVAFYDGEGISLSLNWQIGLDTGKTAKCAVAGILSGTIVWQGVGTLPPVGQPLVFEPPFPPKGLEPPIGGYIAKCAFSDGGGSGSIQFSVSPAPKR